MVKLILFKVETYPLKLSQCISRYYRLPCLTHLAPSLICLVIFTSVSGKDCNLLHFVLPIKAKCALGVFYLPTTGEINKLFQKVRAR